MNLKEFGIEKDKNDILKSFKSRFVNNPNEILKNPIQRYQN